MVVDLALREQDPALELRPDFAERYARSWADLKPMRRRELVTPMNQYR